MDNATLDHLKSALRKLIVDSIVDCFAELKKHLPEFSSKFSALLLLESRLNDANLQRIEGTLSDDDLQLRYNQIRADLLLFINALEVNDFALPVAGTPKAKSGSLLYKIPTRMQLQQETKCVVRLAYDKAVIIRNIELSDDVRIKPVRVSQVMQVELLDPTEPRPFAIRPMSDEEQFLETDDYTEWVFYVEPLLEGTFPLVLKISVVEIVMGKERLRNLTYEESIQITAMPAGEAEPEFKPTGVTLDAPADSATRGLDAPAAAEAEEMVLPEVEEMILPAPPAPAPQVLPPIERKPQTDPLPPTPRRRSMLPMLATLASVLLVLTVAIFTVLTSNNKTVEYAPGDESLPGYQDSTYTPPLDSVAKDSL